MHQQTMKRRSNRPENRHVRKAANLLAQALSKGFAKSISLCRADRALSGAPRHPYLFRGGTLCRNEQGIDYPRGLVLIPGEGLVPAGSPDPVFQPPFSEQGQKT